MNAQVEELEATSLAFLSLGALFSRGFHPVEDLWVKDIPILAEAIAESDFDTSGWAAETHRVLIREVHPFANVFLSSNAQLGGLRTQWVEEDLEKMGLEIDTAPDEPDHLAYLVIALGHLIGAEYEAAEDGAIQAVIGLRALQARWIDDHLTPWLHIVQQAIRQQESALYAELITLITELVCSSRRRLPSPYTPTRPFVLPPLLTDLEQPNQDLEAIATQLTTPALSGWYLSRGWLSRTGAELDLPTGQGSRQSMMLYLLHGAIDQGVLPKLCEHLLQLAKGWAKGIERQGNRPCPGWRTISRVWRMRIENTCQVLNHLKSSGDWLYKH